MKKRLAFLLVALILMGTASVYAAEAPVDRETGIITVSGTAEPFASVRLLVLKENKTTADLTGLTPAQMMEVVEHIDQTRADADGNYIFTYQNDEGDNYVKFAALVNTTNEQYVAESLEIKYYTSNTSVTLGAQMIALTDALSVSNMIDADTIGILGLNPGFFDLLTDGEKNVVYEAVANMTSGTTADLQKVFYDASAVGFINQQTDFTALYTKLESENYTDEALGFDKSLDLYKGLNNPTALEKRVLALLPATGLSEFRSGAREAFALEAIENYKYTFTGDILNTYNDVLQLDLSLLNASNTNSVYQQLAGKHYDTVQAFRQAYQTAVTSIGTGTVILPSFGGGGGGGTGGSFQGAGGAGISGNVSQKPTATPEKPEEKSFSDLAETHYASEAVSYLVEQGVISGYPDGSFQPAKEVSRMEFIKMLVLAFELKKTETPIGEYTDLAKDSWYYDYCVAGVSNGILSGVSETELGTALPVKRQDVCVLLSRILEKKGLQLQQTETVSFADEAEISGYAQESVSALAGAGMISGSDGSFLPQNTASRAECAKMIYNVLQEVLK